MKVSREGGEAPSGVRPDRVRIIPGDGWVELRPMWWSARRPSGELAWVRTSRGGFCFDPLDPWLTPLAHLDAGVDQTWLASLLGSAAVAAMAAGADDAEVQPTPAVALLARIAVGTWLHRHLRSSCPPGRPPASDALWAVELGALCWMARAQLGSRGPAARWLSDADGEIAALLAGSGQGAPARRLALVAAQARAAGGDRRPLVGEVEQSMAAPEFVARVLAERSRTAHGLGMAVLDIDPDAPFLAEAATDGVSWPYVAVAPEPGDGSN